MREPSKGRSILHNHTGEVGNPTSYQRKTLPLFLTLLPAVVLLLPILALAGEYVLIVGFEQEVCKAYRKNLNSFKDLPCAMVCERKLNPIFKDFSKPEWKPMDVWANRDLARKINKWLDHRHSKDPYESNPALYEQDLKKWLSEGYPRMYETYIDIDNSGTIDHVIRNDNDRGKGLCDPCNARHFSSPSGRSYVVIDDKTGKLDKELSNFLDRRWDIFIYKGRVYLDAFGGDLGFRDGQLSVAESKYGFGGWHETCVFRYRERTQKKP